MRRGHTQTLALALALALTLTLTLTLTLPLTLTLTLTLTCACDEGIPWSCSRAPAGRAWRGGDTEVTPCRRQAGRVKSAVSAWGSPGADLTAAALTG